MCVILCVHIFAYVCMLGVGAWIGELRPASTRSTRNHLSQLGPNCSCAYHGKGFFWRKEGTKSSTNFGPLLLRLNYSTVETKQTKTNQTHRVTMFRRKISVRDNSVMRDTTKLISIGFGDLC